MLVKRLFGSPNFSFLRVSGDLHHPTIVNLVAYLQHDETVTLASSTPLLHLTSCPGSFWHPGIYLTARGWILESVETR